MTDGRPESGRVLPGVGHPLGDNTKPEWDGSGGASTRLSTSDAKAGEAAATAESPPAPLPEPPVPGVERERVNARLNGCEHLRVMALLPPSGWVCEDCDQAFIPLLTEPVRPRANSGNSRLSGFQEW